MPKTNSSFTYFICFSADGNYEVRYKSNVLIYPDGEVLWVPPAIYQVGHQNIYYTTRAIYTIKGFDTTTTFCCYVHRIIVFYETTSLHRSYVINLRQSLASILSFILKNSSLFEGTDGTSLLILFLGFQGKGNIIFDRTVPSKKNHFRARSQTM